VAIVDLDLLEALFDLAPGGVAIADERGRYVHVNRTYCEMFGYTAEQLLGRTFGLILRDDDKFHEAAYLRRALDNDCTAPDVWRVQHADGHLLTVRAAFRSVCRPDGSVRILTVLTDVSALEQATQGLQATQQALIQLNDSLERQVTERTRALAEFNHALSRLSREDALTGIANRRAFEEEAAEAMAMATRYGRQLSLVLLDLDHFKLVNDEYGHHAGDEVLREMACRFRVLLRTSDKVARWGGEEFIMLLPETALDDAVAAGQKMLQAVTASPIPTSAGDIVCAFSAGVVEWLPGETLVNLVRRADEHLYRAKRGGRAQLSWDRHLTEPTLFSLVG